MTSPSKRQRAIAAGARVFLRFGFARATMGDIAKAAGMSRPALYLIFRGKEEVFEAVVAQWVEDSLARMAAGLADRATLGEKLRFACETWCLEGLELALANPDVRDMSGLPAVRKSYARFETCLTEILREAAGRSGLGVTAAGFCAGDRLRHAGVQTDRAEFRGDAAPDRCAGAGCRARFGGLPSGGRAKHLISQDFVFNQRPKNGIVTIARPVVQK